MAEMQLALYILGHTTHSRAALANLRRFCEEHLEGRYELLVFDILENPDAAEEANIVATPTLIKLAPKPVCRLIGDLSRTETVLAALGLDDNSHPAEKLTP